MKNPKPLIPAGKMPGACLPKAVKRALRADRLGRGDSYPTLKMSKNYLLNQLAQHMQADLADAIGAQEEEILRAIAKASENGTDSEEPVKFAVTLRGVLNLDANTVETAFSFATRTSVKEKHALEDPKQAKLPLDGVSVSIRTTGPWSSVELDPVTDPFIHVHRTIEGALEKGGYEQGADGVYRKEGEE